MDNAFVLVLGAGLAGAGCASRLPGVRIFEAEQQVGGHAASHAWNGMYFDEGAHISHSKDQDFLRRIGIGTRDDIVDIVSKTGNWDRGRWLSYPVQNHLHELPEDERTQALNDFMRAQATKNETPANYREWCQSQYGEYLTQTYYKRYTDKYWRTDMTAMDTDWLSGRLLPSQVDRVIAGSRASQEETQPVFSTFRYVKNGGFMQLMRPLFSGMNVTCGQRAVGVDRQQKTVTFASGRVESYKHLISTIPLPRLIEMISDVPQTVRDAVATLRWTQLICVNFLVSRPRVVPYHWFYIYDEDIEASRVSVPTSLAGGDENITAFQAELFRRNDESFSMDGLGERVVGQLLKVLNIQREEVIDIQTTHVPFGYVIPCLGHAKAVEHITQWLRQQNIEVAGLHGRWKYVWSDAAFRSGEEVAATICNNR